MQQTILKRKSEDLGEGVRAVVDDVANSEQPIVITSDGKSQVVIMSCSLYETSQKRLQMLESLIQGEMEIARGEGYDLEDVMDGLQSILDS